MGTPEQVVTISAAQWNEKKVRGLTAVVRDRTYIVMTHAITHEPVYQSVAICGADASREGMQRQA
jgi:hypothetical protein